MNNPMNSFYKHLDECYQCRDHPFNLCKEGAELLKQSVYTIYDLAERFTVVINPQNVPFVRDRHTNMYAVFIYVQTAIDVCSVLNKNIVTVGEFLWWSEEKMERFCPIDNPMPRGIK